MRDITSGMETVVTATLSRPLVLCKFEFADGDLFVWNGLGDLTWGGDTYVGALESGSITPVTETLELEANGLVFTLSGVVDEHISLALAANYQNRLCHVWFGAFDENEAIIADPFKLYKGRMDVLTIEEGAETSEVKISSESMLVILNNASRRRYNDQDQKTDYPTDEGLAFVAGINDGRRVQWGN